MQDRLAALALVVARVARQAGLALLILLAFILVAEIALRARGIEPQDLYRRNFTATVPDRWTEWAMRPNVRVNEYAVTNAFGLHEDREVTLKKPPGVRRVAVVGSSVVWGLGENLEDTIPRSVERELHQAGCRAEVLNFASHGFNILNVASYVQTKIHQFEPDAVVVVMDLQMAVPNFPAPNPLDPEATAIQRLGFFEALFKRLTEYSAFFTALDDVKIPRAIFTTWLPFPVEVKNPTKEGSVTAVTEDPTRARFLKWSRERLEASLKLLRGKASRDGITMKSAPAVPNGAGEPLSSEAYEQRRRRELAGVVASVSAFSREMGFPIYFVTPYGPYWHASDEEFRKFSLGMLAKAAPLYGGLPNAARREAELATTAISGAASKEGARVIDMLPRSREATPASGDFSSDGIHFSKQGYRKMGAIIAGRLLKDGLCAGGKG
jgi:hypothetical protein